jgi:hypothetical protein
MGRGVEAIFGLKGKRKKAKVKRKKAKVQRTCNL